MSGPADQLDPDLAALARQAAELDAPPPLPGADPAAQAGAELAEVDQVGRELAGVLLVLGQALAMRWPRVGALYAPAACQANAAAIAPALVRLGWWSSGGDTALYVTAAAAAITLGMGTWSAIKTEDRAQLEAPPPDKPEPGAPMMPTIDRTDPSSLHVRA